MRFGVREICDVVFKAKSTIILGNRTFHPGQPVLYIDSAKTSTVEGAATTVYAQGGKGNSNLIAWEGEKTLTFTVEDALLSPISFSMLSGAGLFGGNDASTGNVHVHRTTTTTVGTGGTVDLTDALENDENICSTAPIFVVSSNAGEVEGTLYEVAEKPSKKTIKLKTEGATDNYTNAKEGDEVTVDYYVIKAATTVSELVIDAENFAGYYYVEASTLFRKQKNGKDMPAELTLPNVKIQSNFTFTMASSGDPSTFTFTMDAMPGYTYFDRTKKVLCVIQIIDAEKANKGNKSVMGHAEAQKDAKDDEGNDFVDSFPSEE